MIERENVSISSIIGRAVSGLRALRPMAKHDRSRCFCRAARSPPAGVSVGRAARVRMFCENPLASRTSPQAASIVRDRLDR